MDKLQEETKKVQKEEEKSKSYLLTNVQWSEVKYLNQDIQDIMLQHNYKYPSKIQLVSLNLTLDPKNKGRHFLIKAPNGTGKTLTFAVPALQLLNFDLPCFKEKDKKSKKMGKNQQQSKDKQQESNLHFLPQVVIVSETALQVDQVKKYIEKLIPEEWKKQNIEINILYGDKQLEFKGQVLVTTPELFQKLVTRYDKISLENLKLLAIDEADANMTNYESDLLVIFQLIQKLFQQGKDIQIIMASATWSPQILSLVEKQLNKPIEIGLETNDQDQLEGVSHYYYELNNKQIFSQKEKGKEDFCDVIIDLIYLVSVEKKLNTQIIIFMNELRLVKQFIQKLQKSKVSGLKYDQIDSSIGDNMTRIAKLQEFRDQKFQILFTTNIMSRGIDIRTVGLVINVGTPRVKQRSQINCETYLHRVARTGRFSDKGVALTLMTMKKDQPPDQTMEDIQLVKLVESQYKQKISELDSIDPFIKDIQEAIENNSKQIEKLVNDVINVKEVNQVDEDEQPENGKAQQQQQNADQAESANKQQEQKKNVAQEEPIVQKEKDVQEQKQLEKQLENTGLEEKKQ